MGCTNSKDGPAPGAVDLQPWDQADQFLQATRAKPGLQAATASAPAVAEERRLSEPSITSVIETPTASFSSKLQPEERSQPRASSPREGNRASSPPNGSASSSQSRRRHSQRTVLPRPGGKYPAPPPAPAAPAVAAAEVMPVLAPPPVAPFAPPPAAPPPAAPPPVAAPVAAAASVPDSRPEEASVGGLEEASLAQKRVGGGDAEGRRKKSRRRRQRVPLRAAAGEATPSSAPVALIAAEEATLVLAPVPSLDAAYKAAALVSPGSTPAALAVAPVAPVAPIAPIAPGAATGLSTPAVPTAPAVPAAPAVAAPRRSSCTATPAGAPPVRPARAPAVPDAAPAAPARASRAAVDRAAVTEQATLVLASDLLPLSRRVTLAELPEKEVNRKGGAPGGTPEEWEPFTQEELKLLRQVEAWMSDRRGDTYSSCTRYSCTRCSCTRCSCMTYHSP